MKGRGLTVCVAAVVLAAIRVQGQQAPQETVHNSPRLLRQSVGAGSWYSARDTAGQRNWQVQVKHFDDDSLTGRITVVGSARIRMAKIVGQISGSDIYGVIVNDNDVQLGTFSGTIGQGGINGTYTTADGDTGNWSSNAPWSQ